MPLHFVFTSRIESPAKKAKTSSGKNNEMSPGEKVRALFDELDPQKQAWLFNHFGDGATIQHESQLLKYMEVMASHTHTIPNAQHALSVSVVQEFLPHDEKTVIVMIHAFEVAEEGKVPASGKPISISTFVSPPGLNQNKRIGSCIEGELVLKTLS